MGKVTNAFVLVLPDRHCSGLSGKRLDSALRTCAKFALTGTLRKLDPRGRIPIEDCGLAISSEAKSATLTISIPAKREQELNAAVATAWRELLGEIDRWGVDKLITAGRQAYD